MKNKTKIFDWRQVVSILLLKNYYYLSFRMFSLCYGPYICIFPVSQNFFGAVVYIQIAISKSACLQKLAM